MYDVIGGVVKIERFHHTNSDPNVKKCDLNHR